MKFKLCPIKSFLITARNMFFAELEYRFNYYLLIFSGFVTLFMEYAVLSHVFKNHELQGFLKEEQLLSFIILGTLLRSSSQLWSLVFEMVDEIRDGSFSRYLFQPIHFPSYFFAKAVGGKIVTWSICLGILLSLQFSKNLGILQDPLQLAAFLLSFFLGIVLCWLIYLCLIFLGFWIEEASFLNTAFNLGIGVFSGSMVPLDWFPKTLQEFLKRTPFPLLGDFPIQVGLGVISFGPQYFETLGLFLFWILFFAILSKVLWTLGTKRYEAFGG